MKYLTKIIEYGLYLLVFLLPLQTRWIIKAGELNGGPWEYGTYSLYATDLLLIFVLALFIVHEIASSPGSSPGLKAFLAMTEKKELDCGSEPAMTVKTGSNGRMIWRLIGGLILASAVSVFFALDRSLALYKFAGLVLGIGMFWLVRQADYSRLKLIYALFAGAFLQASLGVWQFLNQATFANKWLGLALHRAADLGASVVETVGADGLGERWLRAYGGLDHPNVLGGVMAIVILLLIGQIITKGRIYNFQFSIFNFQTIFNDKIFKLINWLFVLVFTAALFFSFSRGAWLALAVGLAAALVWAVAKGNLKVQKGLAETILVMGILSFLLFSQYGNLVNARLGGEGRLEAKSNLERLTSYQAAWQIIKNNWLLGAGPGNYGLVLQQEIKPTEQSYYYQPAHNVFMLVWAETGIFGIIFFIALIVFVFVRFPVSSTGLKASLALCRNDSKTAVLIALVVLMSLDHWLWSLHFGVLFYWLILGIAAGSKRDNELITV